MTGPRFVSIVVKSMFHLHFGNGSLAHRGVPDGESCDTLLRKRAVEDAIGAKLLLETDGATKNASEADILAKHDLRRNRRKKQGIKVINTFGVHRLFACPKSAIAGTSSGDVVTAT